MRFLILSQYFPPEVGAPQTRLIAMAHELVRLGHEVEVVTTLPSYPSGRIFPEYRKCFYRYEQCEGTPIHRVWAYASVGRGTKRILNYISFTVTSLYGLLKAKKPDYIFIESPPLFLSVPGFIMSWLWGVPFIFNVSDLWPDSVRELGIMRDGLLMRAAGALERWTYRKANFINATTEGIRARLINDKGVPVKKLLFLPNGVDTNLFAPTRPDHVLIQSLGLQGKKVVLYVGTIGYAHALDSVLAAAKLLTEGHQVHFLFVGDGSEKARLVWVAQEHCLNNVTFSDWVPLDQVPRYLSIALCGLVSLRDLPFFRDARPAKTLPIMACGKPVIFCGSGDEEGACMVARARAGMLVQQGNPEALAAAIRSLVNNPALAAELGRNGRKYAEENLGWSLIVNTWVRTLTQYSQSSGLVVGRTSL